MELTELQPIEKWQELLIQIEAMSPLRASVYNPQGIRIVNGQGAANQLCTEIKATDKGQAFICAVAHMNLATIAQNTRKAVIEECDAGLLKIVVPIFVKDEFIGAVGGCGLLPKGGEVDEFMVSKTTEIAEEKVEELSRDIGTISSETADKIADFIQTQIDKLVANQS